MVDSFNCEKCSQLIPEGEEKKHPKPMYLKTLPGMEVFGRNTTICGAKYHLYCSGCYSKESLNSSNPTAEDLLFRKRLFEAKNAPEEKRWLFKTERSPTLEEFEDGWGARMKRKSELFSEHFREGLKKKKV